ncbi:hypothetical protein ABB37_04812 [Leptomonas pyrrhocoris]|uniref:Uncharacterized protein n=1 Tax=Leptomonas pyrrhocoris TaxID=157538 RepID=A0A0M9G248_LEPPY|nr:hypothetical protein ABB37_04812 [Leptomonas pyrrhocoris]KPA80616.1 hypothetical protein ABB37_04812 [Leptomonas pyrrhocoris]|eukprot:XP_015659055.1 hypothetical protein ABB37_04812 [Leptomonas pyrrhocoris]
MSRRASLVVACAAVLLVLLAVTAFAATPRCAEDGSRIEKAVVAFPALLRGSLSYNGVSGCASDARASFDIVNRSAISTMAKMNNWDFIVALRSADPVVYTLSAKCNSAVVCEAQITFVAKSD